MFVRSNGGEVAAALRQIAAEYPRELPRILSTVGLGLRKRMSAAMPNGAPPLKFKAWNAFTLLLKTRRKYRQTMKLYKKSGLMSDGSNTDLKRKKSGELTKASLRKLEVRATKRNRLRTLQRKSVSFGGILNNAGSFRFKKNKDSIAVGYFDGLKEYAQAFQTKSARALTKEERHFRHTLQGKNIDRRYIRPAREVMKPFSKDPATLAYIVDVAKKRLASIVEKQAKKVSAVAV